MLSRITDAIAVCREPVTSTAMNKLRFKNIAFETEPAGSFSALPQGELG
jgi:hypothetical protein